MYRKLKLTADEAEAIQSIRELFYKIEYAAAYGNDDKFRNGLLVGRIQTANGALFDVLNCFSSHFDDPEANRVIPRGTSTYFGGFDKSARGSYT